MKITTFERYLAPAGRILMGAFFISSGLGKAVHISGTMAYIALVGLPLPGILTLAAIAIEVIGGFMLLTGYKGKFGALMLAGFVLVVTPPFHGFRTWATDPAQQLMFMKNIALFGALLFMAAHINRVARVVDAENDAATKTKPTPTL